MTRDYLPGWALSAAGGNLLANEFWICGLLLVFTGIVMSLNTESRIQQATTKQGDEA